MGDQFTHASIHPNTHKNDKWQCGHPFALREHNKNQSDSLPRSTLRWRKAVFKCVCWCGVCMCALIWFIDFYQRGQNLNATHYWKEMELVTLHLFLSWTKCPLVYYHISFALTDIFVQTLGRVFEGVLNLLFKWKKTELNCSHQIQ